MRVLVVGDVHWSEYSSIIRKRGEKYSKRLENLINSVNWVEETAEINNVDRIVYLGDFFDKQTLNANEISALEEVVWAKIPHDFVVGNHEGLSEDLSISSAHIFGLIPGARVLDKPTFDCGYGYWFLYLPYSKEEDRKSVKYWINHFTSGYVYTQELKQTIVFSHNDIKVQYGLLPVTIGYELEDIDNNCDLFLNGHLHNGGQFSRAGHNLGILTGQNFGEDATKYNHSIMLVDTQERSLDTFENPYAFNFYKSEISSMKELTDNFLYNIKRNAVVTLKAPERIVSDVKGALSEDERVVEYRVVSIPDKILDEDGKDETVIESVNHLEDFVNFVKDNMEITTIVAEELSEVCR